MPSLATFIAQSGAAPNLPLQVPRDFLPIGFTAENPMFFAVNPSLGVNTLAELIALAKQKPGEVTYATTGVGRLTHLTGELLQMRADIKLLLVPYNGGPARAVSDVANGRVDFIIEGYSGIAAAIKSGLLKPIAVASAERLSGFPGPADRRRRRSQASRRPAGRSWRHRKARPTRSSRRSAPTCARWSTMRRSSAGSASSAATRVT